MLLFIHGGGFAVGDVPSNNDICSSLAELTDSVIVSVNYRLAPEYKFPAALEDVRDSLIWIEQNIEFFGGSKEKVAIMGESAGGNLAASAIAMNIDQPYISLTLRHAYLIYPPMEQGSIRESVFKNRNTNGLLAEVQINYLWSLYLNDVNERNDYRACPILTPNDVLAKFPPTTLVLAKHDTLFDEGFEFGRRLSANGVHVDFDVYNSTIHGFFGRFGPGAAALKKTAQSFRHALHEE